MSELFTHLPHAVAPGYINLRTASGSEAKQCRDFCEYLWDRFKPYADDGFLQDFPTHLHQRFWEMYLTVAILRAGHRIDARKPGPDIGLLHRGKRIWIEAVAATQGDQTKPDSVPHYEPKLGEVSSRDVPTDQIILRCTAAISAKFPTQYIRHVELGVINPGDCYIVAVNLAQADYWIDQGTPPYILRAVLGLHHPFVVLDRTTGEIREQGIHYRGQIPKKQGAAVDADLFLSDESSDVSAVICSVTKVSTPANLPHSERLMGQDFLMVHNPMAHTPVPLGLLARGTDFHTSLYDDHFQVSEKRLRWACAHLLLTFLRRAGFWVVVCLTKRHRT